MNRREILKQLSVLPLAGGIAESTPYFENTTSPTANPDNIYQSIGVETIINCRGTFTIIGGSIERPEVLKAMEQATGYFVQYDELAFAVGKRLAELAKCEWGIVTSGCAAALKHFTVACITGGDPEKLIRIPDLSGFEKTEVIIPRHSRNLYDHAVRNVGVKIITVDTPEALKQAINKRTAMIYLVMGKNTDKGQPLSLEVIADIVGSYNIPILADAAAEDLTLPPIHLSRGATAVAYSGGKAICGPQCAGLLLGRKDLLMAAWQASSPHHGPGRDNKVGKEEIMGMLAAVEAWTTRDHQKEWDRWLSWLGLISEKVGKIEGISTEIRAPEGLSNRAPVLYIIWDPKQLPITGFEVAEDLGRKPPRVAIGDRNFEGKTAVHITPNQMREGQAEIVADRLFGVLTKKHQPKQEVLKAPSSNISGHWNLKMNFFTSSSDHHLVLSQEENWIQGFHQTEFEHFEVAGMIEGDEVKLRSSYHVPGNHLVYLFSGKLEGQSIKGNVFLGEYLTVSFEATKADKPFKKESILIPGGPPLAT